MKLPRIHLLCLACLILSPAVTPVAAKVFGLSSAQQEIDEARLKLQTENLELDHADGQPSAAISPRGDLLIGDQAIDLTPRQRALLLEHRERVLAIANAGLDAAEQGVGLAGSAVGAVPWLIFGGEKAAKRFEQRIEAEAARIEAQALAICDRLPELLEGQQRLAAELPAFAPFASMTQDDIDDCAKDRREALARVEAMR